MTTTPGEFGSRPAFAGALQALVDVACERRLRRVVFVDASFEGWPLDSPALLASLTTFVRQPGRQLLLLGRGYEALRRRSPRLAAWRRTWAHAVEARRPIDEEVELPSLALADQVLMLALHDRELGRGRVHAVGPEVIRQALQVDAWAQRSVPDFPAYTLGL
ncbi:MAG: hypothetical protein RI988_3672 [Pseudomonadota bacterium]|jgi:hypothetical protein